MNDEALMSRALELARKGWPAVAPNPMVGCVIASNGKVIAEGWHARFGGPHAEVNAIQNLPPGTNTAECVLYVTLEPCNHHGKTPPCTELIISRGFRKVVIGAKDPNPLVSGRGLQRLKQAGLQVTEGILATETRSLNSRFFTFYEKQRPFVLLKWAITADGFISRPGGSAREDNFITRQQALSLVHRLRAENMSVLVGKTTVLNDDPLLTVRHVSGRNPVRLLIDRNLHVPRNARMFNTEAPTLVFNCVKEDRQANISWIKLEPVPDLVEAALKKLHETGIQSVMVEGGSRVLQSFIDKGLWDEAMVFQNPDLIFGAGLKGPVFPLKNTFELVGEDKLFRYVNPDAIGGL
jgi:diaminohydroxyphosphoribosylaminopyrimidine deaminase / 5-amino-6-(5-phosphoribosylamino)uracil reductase